MRRAAFAAGFALPVFALLAGACAHGGSPVPSARATGSPTAMPPAATSASVSPSATAPRSAHIVAISAGHGGPDNIGAVHTNAAGQVDLVEKDLTLDVSRRLDRLLRASGYRTVMVRDCDCSLAETVPGNFAETVRRESQARADVANAAGADVVLLIHFNGSTDPTQFGTSVYYDPDRSFGEKSGQLATSIYSAIISRLHTLGYDSRPRGVLNDSMTAAAALTGTGHTFLLGESPGFRPSQMPGMIGEALFVSNDTEAALLQRDDVHQAIAQAYKDGVDQYFAWLAARGR